MKTQRIFSNRFFSWVKRRALQQAVIHQLAGISYRKSIAPFFPSWRFFEVLSDEPTLWLRVQRSEDQLSRAEWIQAFEMSESMRGWRKLLWNPKSNDRYWKLSAVERWTHQPDSQIESARVIRLAEHDAIRISRRVLPSYEGEGALWMEGEVREGNQVLLQIRPRPLMDHSQTLSETGVGP